MPKCRKDSKHIRGEAWQRLHGQRFVDQCAGCARESPKSELIPLYVRMTNIDSKRMLCRLCYGCLETLAERLGATIPE